MPFLMSYIIFWNHVSLEIPTVVFIRPRTSRPMLRSLPGDAQDMSRRLR